MKKRYICFILISLVVFSLWIVPPFATRIKHENNHRGFVVALEVADKLSDEHIRIYRDVGVNTVIYDAIGETFDTELMSYYKDKGFNVALRVYAGNPKRYNYEAELEEAIKIADVKYLVLRKFKSINVAKMSLDDLIEKYNLTLVVSENMKQLQNEMPVGYKDYQAAADGRIMRAYETFKNPSGTLKGGVKPEEFSNMIFHHMVNSIRDRNTEFFHVNPLEHESFTKDDSVKNTAEVIKSFYGWISRLDYTEHKTPQLKAYKTAGRSTWGAGAFFCFVMFMVCAEIVFRKRCHIFEWLMVIAGLCSLILTFFMPSKLVQLYPTVFALMSACFSFTVTLKFADYISVRRSFAVSLLSVVLCTLLTLGFGSVVISAMMSGMEYHINDAVFRGVKITLLFPVTYAALGAWIYLNEGKISSGIQEVKTLLKKIKVWHIAVLVIVFAVFALYVLRSGNTAISPLENKIRNFISEATSARPRTKEFLIGFPMLSLFAYSMKYSGQKLLKWVFACGASILFASVTNTFCHVFTDYTVSALRTVYGLLFSVPFSAVVLLFCYGVGKLFMKRE